MLSMNHRRDPTCVAVLTLALLTLALLAGACSDPSTGGTGANASSDVNFGDVALSGDSTAVAADTTALDATKLDVTQGEVSAECVDGERTCVGVIATRICVGGVWKVEEKCASPKFCKEGQCALPATCKPGEQGVCAAYDAASVCSKDGKAWLPVDCESGEMCIQGVCKKAACVPGTAVCEGQQFFRTCKEDGSGYGDKSDCKTGAYCLGGECVSLCEQNLKVNSHVGCEYWSADLDNYNDPALFGSENPKFVAHSVVISNPGIYDADISFELSKAYTQTTAPAGGVVPAGKSKEFKMPVMNVDDNSISPKGIHVISTQPVVAYQFNPFNADKAYSNDGSLLLPHNALGKEYYIISRPSGPDTGAIIPGMPAFEPQKGYMTVIATRKGKTKVAVTLGGMGYVKSAPGMGMSLKPFQTVAFMLEQFDVLNLEAYSTLSGIKDMTGTRILADQPVAVFGGHEELVLGYKGGPSESCCAEHVEEQLLPLQAWGNKAICPKTKPRGVEADIWVVMAGAPDVTLKTTPSIPGLDGKKLYAPGQWIEVETTESFVVEADGKIQVGQFIVSNDQTVDWIGDPTFMIHPPFNQFRSDYFILTPIGYTKNHASVLRQPGTNIKLDGQAISTTSFTAIGNSGWELAYVDLKPGMHTFEGDQPFGLSVYGYGPKTAYGYPGGMNLK